ncbi:hypothetical protein A1O3_06375 [Capronia epimyces CBS 606.96]|uniref:Acyltransferase 3 domain-containing protein n=1 Tax=Capronia epimyces CBS 606.96 TaxID=1182542 RepID=W9XPT6_9EURO|nr:uncharacterized protein A1O3_06375 [Capronia epimyces CBS 606.96]EXJ82562.1 hypothetical protein A1O3_06375 [Capronia epimyces CBS 606.96]
MPLVDQDSISLSHAADGPWPTVPSALGFETEKTIKSRRFKRHLVAALPRFARPGGITDREIGPTSYLDALRGYAAVCVFIAHSFNTFGDNWRREPLISFLFHGSSMVALFFVISGYVLSYRLLIYIRKQEFERLISSLASSTFRRYVRLYGSTECACFIAMIMVRFKIYPGCRPPMYKDTFWEQLVDWGWDLVYFSNPFGDIRGWPSSFDSRYLDQMWSIPAEYRGSVAIFAFCTAACRLTTRSRMVLTWVIIVACYIWQAIYVAEFMAGLFIADLSLSRHPERLDNPRSLTGPHHHHKQQTLWEKVGYGCLFVLGIFILGEPDDTTMGIMGTFPWEFLKRFIPGWWDDSGNYLFWLGIGAFMLVYALEFYPTLQKPLNWRYSQYIGDLSFGIYAMHVPLALGPYFQVMIPLREQYLGGWPVIKYIPGLIAYPLMVLIAADYFERVDKQVIRFARWLQTKLFV